MRGGDASEDSDDGDGDDGGDDAVLALVPLLHWHSARRRHRAPAPRMIGVVMAGFAGANLILLEDADV